MQREETLSSIAAFGIFFSTVALKVPYFLSPRELFRLLSSSLFLSYFWIKRLYPWRTGLVAVSVGIVYWVEGRGSIPRQFQYAFLAGSPFQQKGMLDLRLSETTILTSYPCYYVRCVFWNVVDDFCFSFEKNYFTCLCNWWRFVVDCLCVCVRTCVRYAVTHKTWLLSVPVRFQ
jgi:hypothetical protein